MAWLTVLAIVNTVASLFYYLRWIAPLFTTPAPTAGPPEDPVRRRRWATGAAIVAALATLIIGVGAQALWGLLTTTP